MQRKWEYKIAVMIRFARQRKMHDNISWQFLLLHCYFFLSFPKEWTLSRRLLLLLLLRHDVFTSSCACSSFSILRPLITAFFEPAAVSFVALLLLVCVNLHFHSILR
jgi:hypothetical protein